MKLFKPIVFSLFLIGLLILFSQKNRILNRLSNISAQNMNNQQGLSDSMFVYEDFNLDKPGLSLNGSLLEFGAKNCSACRRMETVIDEVEAQFGDNLSIQFFNITKQEGLEMGKKFGVLMIPMQVLLDRKGKVVYKHIGFISTSELSNIIEDKILNQ